MRKRTRYVTCFFRGACAAFLLTKLIRCTKKRIDESNYLHQTWVDKFAKVHKMTLPLPATFNQNLSPDRLEFIARLLLDELYATEDDLIRPTDNGYTRGCTTFMRQRNRIIAEALSGRQPWLTIPNSGNDLVFALGGVPCRFSNDDPANPSKVAVLTANRYQTEFLEFAPATDAGRFCFVINRGYNGADEPTVEFLGFTANDTLACRWVSGTIRVLRVEGQLALPHAVEVAKPVVAPKRRDDGDVAEELVQ